VGTEEQLDTQSQGSPELRRRKKKKKNMEHKNDDDRRSLEVTKMKKNKNTHTLKKSIEASVVEQAELKFVPPHMYFFIIFIEV
jgi:hypothetical protein